MLQKTFDRNRFINISNMETFEDMGVHNNVNNNA